MGIMRGSRRVVAFNGKKYNHFGNADVIDDVWDAIKQLGDKSDIVYFADGSTGFEIFTRRGTGKHKRLSYKQLKRASPREWQKVQETIEYVRS